VGRPSEAGAFAIVEHSEIAGLGRPPLQLLKMPKTDSRQVETILWNFADAVN
jgi:hypothetical protein